ncbi:endonuclease domain-containing protein [Hephaestia caeni]|uniref:endonuclease domain-containing protein n=1 Tax=Hephaestia caeni TaxID=645617 RepID=UPI001FE31E94|nr:endonuclease domain-containing protein [Hephaestia caeni]
MERARKLRRQMSYPEVLLWQRLRGSPMGVKFRRQHPVGPDYSVDFYCASARLAVEVDGEIHAAKGAPAYDARRDVYLRSRGLTVVHIPASEVLRDAGAAAEAIVALASTPLHHRPAADGPPPRAGEDQE